jgi:hypothetical protein
MKKLLAIFGVVVVLAAAAAVGKGWKWSPQMRAGLQSSETVSMTGWTWDSADLSLEPDAGA